MHHHWHPAHFFAAQRPAPARGLDGFLGAVAGTLGAVPGFLAAMAWFVVPVLLMWGLDGDWVAVSLFFGVFIGIIGAVVGGAVGALIGVVIFLTRAHLRHVSWPCADRRPWWLVAAGLWLLVFVPAWWATSLWIEGGLRQFVGIGAC